MQILKLYEEFLAEKVLSAAIFFEILFEIIRLSLARINNSNKIYWVHSFERISER